MSGQDAAAADSGDEPTEFRLLSAKDWRQVRRTRLAALRDSPESFLPTTPHEASWSARRWRRSFRRGRWAVARAGGTIVGLARLSWEKDGPHLSSVWTHPAHRQRRIAFRLVRLLIGQVRGGEVFVWVIHPNKAAFDLYEKLEFERTKEIQTLPSIGREEERLRFGPR